MNFPSFITFTGADEWTDIGRMLELQLRYPIEWGILFSPRRQGGGRYPPISMVTRFHSATRLKLSAHLCGGYSARVIKEGMAGDLPRWLETFLHESCSRAQINTSDTNVDTLLLHRWGVYFGLETILQCRDKFPEDLSLSRVFWLFDASGGGGIEPAEWPTPPGNSRLGKFRGYAGGLNPQNVAKHVKTIGAADPHFYIDMESGVRDELDRFDLDRCEQVCEAVFGDPSWRP